jgi:hypothetical protein
MPIIKYSTQVIGVTLVLIGAAVCSGTAQSQVIAMNLRSDASYSYHQLAPDNDGEFAMPMRLHRQIVSYGSAESPGTIIIDTPNTYLYFILGSGKAIRYGVGIGREGFTWSGVKNIERKSEWPDWIPPRCCTGSRICRSLWPEDLAIRSVREPCISPARCFAFTVPTRPKPSASRSQAAAFVC